MLTGNFDVFRANSLLIWDVNVNTTVSEYTQNPSAGKSINKENMQMQVQFCYIIMSSSVVCRLWTFPCEQHNSSKSYPILMKLHRIVPWWVRKNPIDFCYDDVISDVTVTSFPVKSALELVSTIT